MRRIIHFTNPKGMHLRPSSALAQLCRTLEPKIEIVMPDGTRANARDIFQVLSMGISAGDVVFEAEGPKAEEALSAVEQLLTNYKLDA